MESTIIKKKKKLITWNLSFLEPNPTHPEQKIKISLHNSLFKEQKLYQTKEDSLFKRL